MGASPYTDLSRPPLHEAALRRALVVDGGLWTELRVVAVTGSTNADLAATARVAGDAHAAEGSVLIAEAQSAGKGRLDRQWEAPARSAITLSVLLRPAVPTTRLGWLPLLAGVALVEAVGRIAMVDAALKWPNDLLVRPAVTPSEDDPAVGRAGGTLAGYGKCAGVLAEAVDGAVVVGIGLNVSQRAEELPPGRVVFPATSLLLAGAVTTDRDPLVRGLLRALAAWYARWTDAGGDPHASGLALAYRESCATLGREVTVAMPGDRSLTGLAEDIDDDGRLVVATPTGTRAVPAGDITHLHSR